MPKAREAIRPPEDQLNEQEKRALTHHDEGRPVTIEDNIKDSETAQELLRHAVLLLRQCSAQLSDQRLVIAIRAMTARADEILPKPEKATKSK